jgi:2-hydroxycyclohexanecarboxyl-CoA dehydrogenase
VQTGLAGRSVVVTGANANIGRAIALAFPGEGCRLAAVGRDESKGARVRQELLEHGADDALWARADVTDQAQVHEMVAQVLGRFGAIEVLVNNVVNNVDLDPFVDSNPESWEREIALNLTSTLNCTHAVLPGMIERRSGRIVNIGSTSGIVGDPLLAVYSASKGAVHAFTKVLGRHGITANAIAPYGTLPAGPDDLSPGSRWHPDGLMARLAATRLEELHSIGRRTLLERQTALPAEIGAAAVYLASEGAAFTGQVLWVVGQLTHYRPLRGRRHPASLSAAVALSRHPRPGQSS